MKLDAESYLQSGSNELRVLEYTSCGHSFGINILKVQKIISHPQCLTSGINTHPSVIGIFKDNNIVIPLVDLGYFLGFGKAESLDGKKVVVTEFFNVLNAFLVDSVEWIHHFVWEDVINANDVMKTINQRYVISIVRPDGRRMVPLLDYESMILDLCPELGYKEMEKISKQEFSGQGYRILIAEDSPSVRNMLAAELLELGFEIISACDGREACDILEKDKNFNLVISDVEMPQMDGLALTTAIRSNPEIENMPVIVYSSIGDIGMKTRAEFLKASAHVTKLSIEELMANVVKFVGGVKVIPDRDRQAASDISHTAGENQGPLANISSIDTYPANNQDLGDVKLAIADYSGAAGSAAGVAEMIIMPAIDEAAEGEFVQPENRRSSFDKSSARVKNSGKRKIILETNGVRAASAESAVIADEGGASAGHANNSNKAKAGSKVIKKKRPINSKKSKS